MRIKKIFISFAIEDIRLRDLLLEQAIKKAPDYYFFSVKEPWATDWENEYKKLIEDYDGILFIVTSNTKSASGQLLEAVLANEMSIPLYGIWGDCSYEKLYGIKIEKWNWNNIIMWLNSL